MSDHSRAGLILGIESALIAICVFVFALRIDTRWRLLNQLWWDDLFISLAMLLALMSFTTETVAVHYGAGQHIDRLSKEQIFAWRKAHLVAQLVWTYEMAFIKLSVACMFLRFTRAITWKRTWLTVVWISIFVIVTTTIVTTIFQLTDCKPFALNWNDSIAGTCRSPDVIKKSIISVNVLFALTDFELSLLPLAFILTLQRSTRDKIALACIMGLGLLASTIGVTKFIGFNHTFADPDITWNSVILALCAVIEANVAFIAANIPPLKARSARFFKSVGSIIISRRSRQSAGSTTNLEPPTPKYTPRDRNTSTEDGHMSIDDLSPIGSFSKETPIGSFSQETPATEKQRARDEFV